MLGQEYKKFRADFKMKVISFVKWLYFINCKLFTSVRKIKQNCSGQLRSVLAQILILRVSSLALEQQTAIVAPQPFRH
jgi:hypothetical protein